MLEPHAQPLNPLDQAIIDRLQGDFPLCAYPYDEAAAPLGIDADTLMARLDTLLARRVLTRFGPMFQVERMGGAFVLAALATPEARFAEVAEQVNALPEVAHNYRREHTLNMWFVLATAHPDGIDAARQRIEAATGLTVRLFPKLREYYVGMRFTVGGRAPVGGEVIHRPSHAPATPLSAADTALVRACQAGLPRCRRPYQALADSLGWQEAQVIERLQHMLAHGIIRRIGAAPNHYAIGYTANGMAVFDIDDAHIDACGERLGALAQVSHCYHRPRQPGWPYNLFAMCHGDHRDAVRADVALLREQLGSACRGHDVLFSTAMLKKSGVRI